MTLSNFFLLCFLVGFALSLLSFLFGALHLHLPHHPSVHGVFHHSAAHAPSMARAGAGAAHAGAAAGKGLAGRQKGGAAPVNFMTVCAFLAWFGGVGFLVTRYYALAAVAAVGAALAGGLTGSSIVFVFLAKFLLPHETQLDPADFEMVGTLATVTLPIRSEGIGEIQFSQEGTRRSASARSEDGQALERGAEVVVARYERGMAYVKRFEEMVK
ncbi:MAG TPA: NfeD family protein [Candidatus Acidoferrales bacterium]|nr:NfeD family protein [Candidatus Acidoferrales bacterium]